jgi:hypothetical protein
MTKSRRIWRTPKTTMQTATKTKLIILSALLCAFSLQSVAFAQGTAFTYQGRLNVSGAPASGSYDLAFALFDSITGGTQQDTTITSTATSVSNGLFTVTLDFGNVFPGATRWLEIAAHTNGGSIFTTLSPRQQLTPTPYSLFAEGANATGLSGAVPSASLKGTYGGAVNFTNPGSSFTGNGAGLANVNAVSLTGLATSNFWQLGGNSTVGQLLGTLNNQPLDVYAGGARALHLISQTDASGLYSNAPNVIGGSSVNLVAAGVVGSTVGGGGGKGTNGVTYPNQVNADFGTVGGGLSNAVSGSYAFIGGGQGNTASQSYGTIGGGSQNMVNNAFSTIGGGTQNTASGLGTTVAGGALNAAQRTYSTVGGGLYNAASGVNQGYATVAGGYTNIASGDYSTVAGGYDNKASGYASTAMGFESIANGYASTAMGYFPLASGYATTAMGSSYADGTNSTAFGRSQATNDYATAAGYSFANGQYSTAMGAGIANGDYSTALGGGNSFPAEADGFSSFAAGNGANAHHANSFVWNDGNTVGYFASTAPSQFLIHAIGGVGIGTSAPETPLHIADAGGITLGQSSTGGGYTALRIDLSAVSGGYAEMQAIQTSGTNYGNLILQRIAGKVGIGTAAPDELLSVNGSADKPGGGSWDTFSDGRLKDVGASFTNGLAALEGIEPVHYHYKSANPLNLPSQPEHIGVVAQRVQPTVPEAVQQSPSGYLTVNNDPIIWTMVNAIKELGREKEVRMQKQDAEDAEIERLKQQNESLKNRVNDLEKIVRSLAQKK